MIELNSRQREASHQRRCRIPAAPIMAFRHTTLPYSCEEASRVRTQYIPLLWRAPKWVRLFW